MSGRAGLKAIRTGCGVLIFVARSLIVFTLVWCVVGGFFYEDTPPEGSFGHHARQVAGATCLLVGIGLLIPVLPSWLIALMEESPDEEDGHCPP